MSDDPMLKTIRHEAGFYIVGRCLGMEYSGISFELCSNQSGRLSYWKPTNWVLPSFFSDIEQTKKYCKARIIVLLAGHMSEFLTSSPRGSALDFPSARKSLLEESASDLWRVGELVMLLMNLTNPKGYIYNKDQVSSYRAQILEELIHRTGVIVFNNANAILSLHREILTYYKRRRSFHITTLQLDELSFMQELEAIEP